MMLAIFFFVAIALPNCVVVRADLIKRSSHSGSPTAGAAEGPVRRYLPVASASIGVGSDLPPIPVTRAATGTLPILASWSTPSSTGRSEEHTSALQPRGQVACRLWLDDGTSAQR